jgi:hypothetical protein
MIKTNLLFSWKLVLGLIFIVQTSVAQVYSNKETGKKNADLIDSLKNTEYPYVLPIWGAKTTKLGFNLPYSAGLSSQYIWQKSELTIDNLMVGFNNGPMYNLDEIVRFNNAISEGSGINVRPDIWLFPFLNVYGIFAKTNPSTSVDYSVWIPDGTGSWNEIISLKSKAQFQATTFGFGLTPTIGVGNGWIALDMNVTWSDISALDKPAFAFVFGPRVGKSFNLKKPESNLAFWVGGFRLKLNTATSGSLSAAEVLPLDEVQVKVDNGIQKVEENQIKVDSWWESLSTIEQNNPVNIAKYNTANRALTTAGNVLNSMDESLNDENSATVQYSLDKRPKDMWNFLLGTQYQYNKHWMLRFEYGFLGSRTQVITGIQYRFGL